MDDPKESRHAHRFRVQLMRRAGQNFFYTCWIGKRNETKPSKIQEKISIVSNSSNSTAISNWVTLLLMHNNENQ